MKRAVPITAAPKRPTKGGVRRLLSNYCYWRNRGYSMRTAWQKAQVTL